MVLSSMGTKQNSLRGFSLMNGKGKIERGRKNGEQIKRSDDFKSPCF